MRDTLRVDLAAIVVAGLFLSACTDASVQTSAVSRPDASQAPKSSQAPPAPTPSQAPPAPTPSQAPPAPTPTPQPSPTRSLTPTIAAVPRNDDPPGTVIGSLPFADTTETSQAQIHAMEPTLQCGSGSNSVWYAYTAAADHAIVVDTTGSEYDTLIDVWTGALTADRIEPGFEQLTPLTCNDNTADSIQAAVVFQVTAGESYVIRVMAALDSTGGPLRLTVAAD